MPRWSNFLVKDLYDLGLTKFCFSVLYDSLYKKKNDDKRNPTYTNFFEYVMPNTYISLVLSKCHKSIDNSIDFYLFTLS